MIQSQSVYCRAANVFSELPVTAGKGIWSTELFSARNDTITGLDEAFAYKSPIKKKARPNPIKKVTNQNSLKSNPSVSTQPKAQ